MNFIYYVIIAIILTRVRYVGVYFRVFNTLVHELGHVMMSILTFGEVYRVHLNKDASGVAYTGSRNRLSRILVSLAGYPTSSIVSYYAIVLLREEQYTKILAGLIVVFIFSLIFLVRNLYGFMWLLSAILISLTLMYYGSEKLIGVFLSLLIGVIFVDSVLSTFNLVYITIKDKEQAGDATNLRDATKLPVMFWSLLFSCFSLYTVYEVIILYY